MDWQAVLHRQDDGDGVIRLHIISEADLVRRQEHGEHNLR